MLVSFWNRSHVRGRECPHVQGRECPHVRGTECCCSVLIRPPFLSCMLLIGLTTLGNPHALRLLLRSPLHQGSAPCPLTTRGGTQATPLPMAPPPSPRRPTLLLSTSGQRVPSTLLPAPSSPGWSPAPPHPPPFRTLLTTRREFCFFTSAASCARREVISSCRKARPQTVLPLLSCVRM